jgi:hypothetical protein
MKLFLIGIFLSSVCLGAAPRLYDFSEQAALNILARQSKVEHALGSIPGQTTNTKFGLNSDVDTGGYEVIWSNGGAYTIPTGAETLNIASTSANDASGDTGARTVLVSGIDGSGDSVTESVTMDGTADATTSTLFKGVNRLAITSSGSGDTNAGAITATQSSSGYVLAHMPTGYSVTQQLIYTVPDDEQAYIDNIKLYTNKLSGSSPQVRFQGVVYNFTTDTKYIIFEDLMDSSVENHRIISDFKSQALLANEVFYIQALTDNNNTEVFARMKLINREK